MTTLNARTRFVVLTCCMLMLTTFMHAQLSVTSTDDADALAQTLAGSGIYITNASINCPTNAAGYFNGITELEIESGILLTTGVVGNAVGPNDEGGEGTNWGAPGDIDLGNLVNYSTCDACTLEFDFVAVSENISFDYVFASEEYPEYFCTEFNDIFAFFISGPNPAGGFYDNENIALIPGTSVPVTINNLGPGFCQGVNNSGLYYPNQTNNFNIQYDGWTVPLTAMTNVVPCEVYHLKLGLTDVGDCLLDSGVFFEENSFSSSFAVLCNGQDITETCDCNVCPGETATIELINVDDFGWAWTDPDGILDTIAGTTIVATPGNGSNTFMVSGACGVAMLDKVIAINIVNTNFDFVADCENSDPNGFINVNVEMMGGIPPYSYTVDNGIPETRLDSSFVAFVPNFTTSTLTVTDATGCGFSQDVEADCCFFNPGNCVLNIEPQILEACDLSIVPPAETELDSVFNEYNICGNTLFSIVDLEDGIFCDADNPLQLTRIYILGDDLNLNGVLETDEPSATCTQLFTINDSQTPFLTVPANTTVSCDVDLNDLSITGNADAADNCFALAIDFNDNANLQCVGTGSIIRTWTATDACGNIFSANQTISIFDNDAPTFSPPVDLTISCEEDVNDLLITGYVSSEIDNCSDVTILYEDAFSPDCGATGILTRTWTAFDDCSNQAMLTQLITIEDNTLPSFTVPEDRTISCEQDPADLELTGDATDLSDNCLLPNIIYTDQFDQTCGNTGIITRTWTATDECGNQLVLVQTIAIEDITPPEFSGPDNVTISCNEDLNDLNLTGIYSDEIDNCSVVIVDFFDAFIASCGSAGVNFRTWIATDACGNTSTLSQIIVIEDLGNPILSIPVDVTISCNDDPLDLLLTGNAASADLCATASANFEDNFVASCGNSGLIERTWTAADECGNMITNVQRITIVDNTVPAFFAPPNLTISCDEDYENLSLTGEVEEESDDCSNTIVSYEDLFVADCGNDGVVVRTWTVTDDCGNSASSAQLIEIEDNFVPMITAPEDLALDCSIDPMDVTMTGEATATPDDCSSIDIDFTDEIVTSCGNNSSIVRTWRVTDACGNTSTAIQNINFEDSTGPNFAVPADVSVSCSDDLSNLDLTGNISFLADNCSSAEIIFQDTVINTCGDVIRTWIGTDECGNQTTKTQTISVVDNVVPLITCPDDSSHQLGSGECDLVVNWELPTVSDDCYVTPVITQVEGPGNGSALTYEDSPYLITYVVSDACGNDNYCSFTITILPTEGEFALACNDQLNLSFDEECEAQIDASIVLNGTSIYPCFDQFDIELYEGPDLQIPLDLNPDNDLITDVYIGEFITVVVTINGNSCWSTILVEGKIPPTLECPDSIGFFCADLNAILDGTIDSGEPIVTPYCNEVELLPYVDVVEDLGCYGQVIHRTWTLVYDNGYGPEEISCTQVITLEHPTMEDVVLPEPLILTCGAIGDLSADSLLVQNYNSAFPYVSTSFGDYPIDEIVCSLGASYQDAPIIPLCGGSYEIVRFWTILDWCVGGEYSHVQNIKVMDQFPPEIACPDAQEFLTTSPQSCAVEVPILFPEVTDECSGFTVNVTTPEGDFTLDENETTYVTLSAGDHEFIYTATDECGNVSDTCTVAILVIDNQEPIAICDQNTVVSLNETGIAEVCSDTFNDGSYDACVDVVVRLKKMNAQTSQDFEDCISYTCEDLENTCDAFLQLRMRVYDVIGDFSEEDENGRYTECMIIVHLNNSVLPSIACPEDLVLDCMADPADIPEILETQEAGTYPVYNENILLGYYPASVNCNEARIDVSLTGERDNCQEGSFVRTWTLTDDCGRISECVQNVIIQVAQDQYFSGDTNLDDDDDIVWPEYTVDLVCENVGNYEELIAIENTGQPFLFGLQDNCNQLAITHDDLVFTDDPDACYVIYRNWRIVDWCQYEPGGTVGEWIQEQIIRVNDNAAPVFTNDCEQTFLIGDEDGDCQDEFSLTVGAEDNCGEIDFRWTIDGDLDGTIDFEGEGNSVSGTYPFGDYLVTFYAADKCGNETSCNNYFTIFDDKEPSPVCSPGFSTVIMPTSGQIGFTAASFDISSFDTCSDSLQYTINIAPEVAGQIILETESSTTTEVFFSCDQLGEQFVQIWVVDEYGNAAYCLTGVNIQDPNYTCSDPPLVDLAGVVLTENEDKVADVNIMLNGAAEDAFITGTDGAFYFSNLPRSQNYTLTPDKDMDFLNGVTTYDLVLMSKHILGVAALDSPYKLIAADVNGSNQITTFDLVKLRRLILGIDEEVTNNTSWRFIDKDYVFPNPENPWSHPFPEVITLNGLEEDELAADFIGVKIGDVNGSAIPNMLATINNRQATGNLIFDVQDQFLKEGESCSINIVANDFSEVLGFQFVLKFDPEILTFKNVETVLKSLRKENFALQHTREGELLCSWNVAEGMSITDGSVIFSMTFEAKAKAKLWKVLYFEDSILKTEAYRTTGLNKLKLNFIPDALSNEKFTLFQNRPNPFKTATVIPFNLPEAGIAHLRITDISGKQILEVTDFYEKGFHEIPVTLEGKLNAGLYFYQLHFNGHSQTKKMVIYSKE